MLAGWAILAGGIFSCYSSPFSILLFLCVRGLNVYGVVVSGWASNSKYAFLGAVRGGAQRVRFEIALLFFIIVPCICIGGYSVLDFSGNWFPLVVPLFFLFLCWVPLVLAESNRAPFDFAEGESELVRGFNIEYGGIPFSLLFLGEYGFILAYCWFSGILFGGYFVTMFLVVVYILARGLLPRYRVDLLVTIF